MTSDPPSGCTVENPDYILVWLDQHPAVDGAGLLAWINELAAAPNDQDSQPIPGYYDYRASITPVDVVVTYRLLEATETDPCTIYVRRLATLAEAGIGERDWWAEWDDHGGPPGELPFNT